jgi:hypothetical protein
MEVPKIYPHSSEVVAEGIRAFDWEGDVLHTTDTLRVKFGEVTDREVLSHYETDFTELREFLEAKRAGKKLRVVEDAYWYWDPDGMDWGLGAWRCSACKAKPPAWWDCDKASPMNKSGHKFCPNCGAEMRRAEA